MPGTVLLLLLLVDVGLLYWGVKLFLAACRVLKDCADVLRLTGPSREGLGMTLGAAGLGLFGWLVGGAVTVFGTYYGYRMLVSLLWGGG